MTAERMPQAEPSLLARPLGWLTRLVLRFPVAVLALAVGAALAALALSGGRLGFRTSRLDLLNPQSSYNRLWIDYIEEFGDEDDVVVVVEGANREQVVPVLEEVSEALKRQDRLFHAVLHEVDLSKIRGKGLHYLKPEELLGIEQFLHEVAPIVVGGNWTQLNLGNTLGRMCARLEQQRAAGMATAATEAEIAQLSGSLLGTLSGRDPDQSPWPEMPDLATTLSELNYDYLLTNEGRLGFVLLRLVKDDGSSFARGTEAIDTLRRLISQVKTRHTEVKIGLTGLPVMENDEMRTSQVSMMEASLLSLLGVACLFVAGFGGLRHPLMAVAVLLLAMAWSFGYVTLAVGHLNILSISFGVILIGLGIDFGVHYTGRYLQLHRAAISSDEALVQTARSVGPGVVTGAVTTAAAFFAAGLTEFTGVAELGIIAGGGILLCLLAALTVLPAMIHLFDARRPNRALPAPLDVYGWIQPLLSRPRTLLAVTAAGTLLVCCGVGRLWYDHNLLNLQPEGLESVELERKLLEQTDQSVWFAVSISDSREELLRREEKFLELPSVLRVEEIAKLLPTDEEQKLPIIQRISGLLSNLPERPPRIPVDPPADLGLVLARGQSVLGRGPQALRTQRQLEMVRQALRQMPLAECYDRLSYYQQRTAGELLSRLYTLQTMANPEPPGLTDLPESLVTRFVSQGGRYLLKIYGRGNIWDMDAMEKFVSEVRSVDPQVTGNPLQTYYASRQMKRSYEQAAWYALAAVLVLLFVDLGSLRYTLLAMLPLGLGMMQLFGLMGLLEIPLNPANMIVLPLILGIGVDDGVHVVHDFRSQRGRYRMSPSTASSVLITSLTTMVGFGSLMIASHRGLQSLGRVLTIGVSCCLFTSLVMLPAILIWMTRNRPENAEDGPDGRTGQLPARQVAPRRTHRRDATHRPHPPRHAAPGVGAAPEQGGRRP